MMVKCLSVVMMIVMVAMIVMVVTMLFDDDSDGDDDNDGGGDVVATSWLPPCQGWPRPPPPTQQGSSSTFNEIALSIYCIHLPFITQQSLFHHHKHLTHQCVIAGEAKRLSTGTEKNPYRCEYPSITDIVIFFSDYGRCVSNLFGNPS